MDTATMIEQCAVGHREAMASLYRAYSPRMLRLILRYVSDPTAAEDILHDGFIVILSHISEVRNPDRLEYWMGTIMKNLALQYLSRLEVATILEEEDEPIDTPDITDILSYEELEVIINKLPEGYRTIFKLAVFENKSHKEIGRMLGIAPHSSSSQLARAKAMLRKLIAERQASLLLLLILLLLPFSTLLLLPDDTSRTSLTEAMESSMSDSTNTTIRTEVFETLLTENKQTTPVKHTPSAKSSHLNSQSATRMPEEIETDTAETDQLPQPETTVQNTPAETTSDDIFAKTNATNSPETPDATNTPNISNPQDKADAPESTSSGPAYASIHSTNKANGWSLGLNYGLKPNLSLSNGNNNDNILCAPGGDPDYFEPPIISSTEKVKKSSSHRLPLTLGVTFNRNLTSNLGIETGLNFTYLRSNVNIVVEELTYSESIVKSYYIGLPLKLNYRLLTVDALSIYVTGGVGIDIPVNHSVRHVSVVQGYTPPAMHTRVQFSIFGGAGLSYRLTRGVSLYAEPSLKFYPDNHSSLPSIRQDHPLDFTLPIGLRFDW